MKALLAKLEAFIAGFTTHPYQGLVHGKMFLQADGTTDLSRVLGAVIVVNYLAIQDYAVVGLHQTLEIQDFGTGLAAVCAGVAVFILGHNYAKH